MQALSMNDISLSGKRVVARLDLNVPVKNGVVTSDARIRAVLPTIRLALDGGAALLLLSHLGRPEEGVFDEAFSLKPVAARLAELLGREVAFCPDILAGVEIRPGEVALGENVRFLKGEKKNDAELAAKLAALGDIYVMDAFGAAHRANASTEGAVRRAAVAVAGPLMLAEMDAAARLLDNPARPLHAIIGGSKVSTKLTVLENLIRHVDVLIVGGGIANTFLEAAGHGMGVSLVEKDLIPEAKRLLGLAKERGTQLPLPVDLVLAPDLQHAERAAIRPVTAVAAGDSAFDIGPETVKLYASLLEKAATIVWNGPVGAFETPPFDGGSRSLAGILAAGEAYTVACGGDTLAALEQFGLADRMNYLSTGGGAFLEALEGRTLPAVAALVARAGGKGKFDGAA
jgi:phosphoglycerate kinase